MSLTKYQKALAVLLTKQGLDLDLTSTIVSILAEDEEATCSLLVWVWDTNAHEEEIMHWLATAE